MSILRPKFSEDKIKELQHTIAGLGPGDVLFLTGPQGIGKTTLAALMVSDHLLDEPKAKIAVIIPNHDFGKEWEWAFVQNQYNHWYGRGQIINNQPMCLVREHPLIKPFFNSDIATGSFMCQLCNGRELLIRYLKDSGLINKMDYCPYTDQFKKKSNIILAVHQYINTHRIENFNPTWVISDDVKLETYYFLPTKAEQMEFIGAFNILQIERAERDEKYEPYTISYENITETSVKMIIQKLRGMFGAFHRTVSSGEEILEHPYWKILVKVRPRDILIHRFIEKALGQEYPQLAIPYLYKLFDLSYQGVKVVIIRATGQANLFKIATRGYSEIFKKIPYIKEHSMASSKPITSQIKRVIGNIHSTGAWYPPTSFKLARYKETQKIIKPKTIFLINRDQPKSIGIVTLKALKEIDKLTNKMKIFNFLPDDIPEDIVEVLHFNALEGKNELHLADMCLRIGTYQQHLADVVESYNVWTRQQLEPEEEIARSHKIEGVPGRVFDNHELEQFRKEQDELRNHEADGRFRLEYRPNKTEYVFGVVYPRTQKRIPTTNVKIYRNRGGQMIEEEYHDFNKIIIEKLAAHDDLYPIKYLTAYLMDETQLSYEPIWRRIKKFEVLNKGYNIYKIEYDGRMRSCLAKEGREW